jgi:hypothetical protein
MASKTTADKLLIKPGSSVWSSHADRLGLIGPLPPGVAVADGLADATTAIVFADDSAAIRGLLAEHRDHLADPEHLWVLYPKGGRADINRDSLWPIVGEHGLRPITQIAVDDTWSALRFRPLREGEPQFTGGR